MARQPRSDDHSTLGWPHSLHYAMANCSSAVLEGVIEVAQCLRMPNHRNTSGIGKCTSGLLLRYRDGHVERLGEARLDLVKSCKVLPTDVLRFTFQKKLVKTCTVGPSQGNDGPSAGCAEIPMRGTLAWCFHEQEALIKHNEQRISPSSSPVVNKEEQYGFPRLYNNGVALGSKTSIERRMNHSAMSQSLPTPQWWGN